MAAKPRGGGAKGLSGRATKKITFCGFPYSRGIFFFSVNKFPQNFVFYKIATKFRAFSTSFQKFDRYFYDFYNRVSKKAKKNRITKHIILM